MGIVFLIGPLLIPNRWIAMLCRRHVLPPVTELYANNCTFIKKFSLWSTTIPWRMTCSVAFLCSRRSGQIKAISFIAAFRFIDFISIAGIKTQQPECNPSNEIISQTNHLFLSTIYAEINIITIDWRWGCCKCTYCCASRIGFPQFQHQLRINK